ncbi:MAG: hypothetical protein CL908_05425 [Deltaproteobacteria bacterium]|nr:hypothetical protein [Deltaproteobacteria bacterium]
MNNDTRLQQIPWRLATGGLFLLAALSCSGGGQTADNGGMSGTGISQGTINSFGSIFVNGTEWQIDAASIEVDDAIGGEIDLRLGMVVTVRGDFDSSGASGTATSVVYDESLEGPIDDDPTLVTPGGSEKEFEVLGQTVVVDEFETVFDGGVTFASIARDDVVEISGFGEGSGALRATRVLWIGLFPTVDEVELAGEVTALAPNGDGTGLFELGPITVEYSQTTDFEGVSESALSNGDPVEVRGRLIGGGTDRIDAAEIELEDEGFEDEDAEDFEIEGIVSSYVSDADFRVAGLPVVASGATIEPAGAMIEDGVRVEVEGALDSGVLMAEEVEIEDAFEQDVHIEAAISAIDPVARTVTMLGITVEIDGQTELEDERDELPNFGFADLVIGDWLEVEARSTSAAGVVLAADADREEIGDDVILSGPISMIDRLTPTISILEQAMPIHGTTRYFDAEGVSVGEAAFFAEPGGVLDTDWVSVTDEDSALPGALLEADLVEIEEQDD